MSIFKSLYYCKMIPNEQRVVHIPEREEIERKIKSEEDYLIGRMSPDDCKRFKALESLYFQSSTDEEVETFSYGFTMGALIMLEIMSGSEGVVNE